MLQDRIKNNMEYFKGMEMTDGLFIVKVLYKERWGAFNSKNNDIKVTKSETTANEWFYFADAETNDIESIFDLIEETIEMNSSVSAKIELLNKKIEELKVIFSETSLSKLETLKFVMDEKMLDKPKKRKYVRKNKLETKINDEITSNND